MNRQAFMAGVSAGLVKAAGDWRLDLTPEQRQFLNHITQQRNTGNMPNKYYYQRLKDLQYMAEQQKMRNVANTVGTTMPAAPSIAATVDKTHDPYGNTTPVLSPVINGEPSDTQSLLAKYYNPAYAKQQMPTIQTGPTPARSTFATYKPPENPVKPKQELSLAAQQAQRSTDSALQLRYALNSGTASGKDYTQQMTQLGSVNDLNGGTRVSPKQQGQLQSVERNVGNIIKRPLPSVSHKTTMQPNHPTGFSDKLRSYQNTGLISGDIYNTLLAKHELATKLQSPGSDDYDYDRGRRLRGDVDLVMNNYARQYERDDPAMNNGKPQPTHNFIGYPKPGSTRTSDFVVPGVTAFQPPTNPTPPMKMAPLAKIAPMPSMPSMPKPLKNIFT